MALMVFAPESVGDYFRSAIVATIWILIALFYPRLVEWLQSFALIGISAADVVGAVGIRFFGRYTTLLSIHWIIIMIAVYKTVDAFLDGVIMSFIDVGLVIFAAIALSGGIIDIALTLFGSTFSIAMDLSAIMLMLGSVYGIILAFDIFSEYTLRTALRAECIQKFGVPNDPQCKCFKDIIFGSDEITKRETQEIQEMGAILERGFKEEEKLAKKIETLPKEEVKVVRFKPSRFF